MKKSIKLNGILNVIKKCCNIILPLLIFPYISRVLGPDNYGKFSFSNSIISYFMLTALLGIETYAVREGSRIRNDKYRIDKFVSEVFSINIMSLIISYIVLLFFIFTNQKIYSYKELILILSIMIPCTVLGRDYINIIFEDYLYITIRYIVIQILGVLAIYLLVKKQEDYLIYTYIYMLTNSLGYLINLVYTRRFCPFKLTIHMNLKRHLLPILILFGGQLAVTIYIQSDITMLGFFYSDKEVGVYTITSKIYMLVKGIINALTTVAIPRISYYLGENQIEKYREFSNKLIKYLFLFVVPLVIGLLFFSENILQIIGGRQYISGANTLKVLSVALFCAVFSGFFCNGLMVPNRKEKEFLVITTLSACINIVLNLFFIPQIGTIGAAVTTLISEVIVLFMSFYTMKQYFKIEWDFKHINSVILAGITVIIVCILCKFLIKDAIIQLIIAMIISALVYCGVLIVLKNDILVSLINEVLKKKNTK